MKILTRSSYRPQGRRGDSLKSYLPAMLAVFLFAYTAMYKMMEHEKFLRTLDAVFVFKDYASFLSWLIPISELAVVVIILHPRTYRTGLWGFIIMMAVFTVYISVMLIWVDKLPCSCGGVIEKLTWPQHLIFNLAFIGLGLFALRQDKVNKQQPLTKF